MQAAARQSVLRRLAFVALAFLGASCTFENRAAREVQGARIEAAPMLKGRRTARGLP